jgi:hypothetical protein
LYKLESPSSKDDFCQVCGSGEEVKHVKVYRQRDGRRTNGNQNFQLRWGKKEEN